MSGNISTGFGRFSFGDAPFGMVDWAQEHFELIPEVIKEEDAELADGNLRKFTDSIGPSFNYLLDKIDKFPQLADPDNVPIEWLPFLAENYSIELEQILSDVAQRGFVRNAYQWMALKGTERGYQIRANTSGFGVEVVPLYRVSVGIEALISVGAIFEIPAGSGSVVQEFLGNGNTNTNQVFTKTLTVPVESAIKPGMVSVKRDGTGTPGTGIEVAVDLSGVIIGTDILGSINYVTGEIVIQEDGVDVWTDLETCDVDFETFGPMYTDKQPLLPFFDETPADEIPLDTYLFEYGDNPPEGVEFHDVSGCTLDQTSQSQRRTSPSPSKRQLHPLV